MSVSLTLNWYPFPMTARLRWVAQALLNDCRWRSRDNPEQQQVGALMPQAARAGQATKYWLTKAKPLSENNYCSPNDLLIKTKYTMHDSKARPIHWLNGLGSKIWVVVSLFQYNGTTAPPNSLLGRWVT